MAAVLLMWTVVTSSRVLAQSNRQLPIVQNQQAQNQQAQSQGGMVVSAHPIATEAGVAVLKAGGNAVDAAVATALMISVVEPFSAGIGGGGFLLIYQHDRQQMAALDFRERAPRQASRNMFLDSSGKPQASYAQRGHRLVAVPGTIAGLYTVHRRYGKRPWPTLVLPAAQVAAQGFSVTPRLATAIARHQELLNPAAQAIFLRNGQPYQPGDILVQKDLGRSLTLLSRDPQTFYQGELARAIVQDMAANQGLITLTDLQAYRAIWRDPLCRNFRRYRVCSMPPPSSGGVHLLQVLGIVGNTDLKAMGRWHPDTLHLLAEMMRLVYADRAQYLGDPDFVSVPVSALLSPGYLAYRRRSINPRFTTPSNQVQMPNLTRLRQLAEESPETTHLTVVDPERNAVSLTFTVNRGFGSGVVVPGTGILLNDEMDDFAIAPGVPNAYGLVGGEANAIAPGKTPLSSMTPTIVTENGQLRLALGAPGGSTIITTVIQLVLNILVFELDAVTAIAAPRLHHQWQPDQLFLEPGIDAATVENLRQRGHAIRQGRSWGNATLIHQRPDDTLEGVADPRGEGTAAGF
ncbi:MAG: gamma-glutamyltransferase [Cyanobacteria bacterium]|nr:gamma-glutamyltransferase [Cyanobacteriota bacterium]MDW8202176.1 gamma-glutamyltransferase [Cyanobacteriota bacterium SKYGB_h_bin112]